MNIEAAICQKAKELGFDTVGFTTPDLPPHAAEGLQEYITAGHHGSMAWMEEKMDRRAAPKTLWPEAKSVIVLGVNYAPKFNPLDKLKYPAMGNISCYALNEDYHDVIKKRLKQLARWMVGEYGGDVKVFVDTAPVMEKPLAAQAGLGWVGKHTCVVSREFGNWLFLGSIFTTIVIPSEAEGSKPDPSTALRSGRDDNKDHCGSCTKCLDICPTNAFTAERKLDARRCISYLTIEHKGKIPHEFRKAIGNRIYGCDDCLAVCPWNKFAQDSQEMKFAPREELYALHLAELAELDDTAFRKLFAKSPVKRIGRESFIRNVLIAIGNSGEKCMLPIAQKLMNDESPVVAEAASWALEELRGSTIS
ncbi:MAG: tRNA epoxyqueuosine(34) reductase QueG [Alphaproteobacteria bacterium]|nr:tRNA epoxyqueuosine(34) reductase QueG [Alphaproteobacteria bacterium]